MAFTDQESNFVSRSQNLASQILDLRDELQREVALYNAEGFGESITDADLAANATFSHLTQSKLWNCITAFNSVLTALGDDANGQAINLIKMRG
jgi:hypothetical protein